MSYIIQISDNTANSFTIQEIECSWCDSVLIEEFESTWCECIELETIYKKEER